MLSSAVLKRKCCKRDWDKKENENRKEKKTSSNRMQLMWKLRKRKWWTAASSIAGGSRGLGTSPGLAGVEASVLEAAHQKDKRKARQKNNCVRDTHVEISSAAKVCVLWNSQSSERGYKSVIKPSHLKVQIQVWPPSRTYTSVEERKIALRK